MTGITNRPEREEDANQQRVEASKDKLPDITAANRPRQDHPVDKDREQPIEGRDRLSETGAGRGAQHQGH